jgi:hypothetical protein
VSTLELWTTVEEILDGCPELQNAEIDLEGIIEYTSDVLFNLSGRQFTGIGEFEVVRPYQLDNAGCSDSEWLWNAGWNTLSSFDATLTPTGWRRRGDCGGACQGTRMRLPGPIHAVGSVDLDGAELAPSTYRVAGKRWLHRIDGGYWPCNQDLSLPLTAGGTFGVTYQRGIAIPRSARWCARKLATEVARSNCGMNCALPPGMVSLNREGVSMSYESTQDLWPEGRTGVREVDLWLRTVNPYARRRRASVYRGGARRVAR